MKAPPEDRYICICKGLCGREVAIRNSLIPAFVETHGSFKNFADNFVCEHCKESKCMAPIEQLEKEAS